MGTARILGDLRNCQPSKGRQGSGVPYKDYKLYTRVLSWQDQEVSGSKILKEVEGFKGPLSDDVPGIGDLANVQVSNLHECASRCRALSDCRSFEFSPTANTVAHARNCQ